MATNLVKAAVRRLAAYTPGEQPADVGVVKLNTNENPYPPSPRVAQALNGFEAGRLRRYPDPVASRVREKLCRLWGARSGNVMVGNGSDELLALSLRAFVESSQAVGFFEPSYSLYPVLCAIAEVTPKPVRLKDDFTWAMPDRYRASLFFLTNPNAPTGMLFPREQVRAFCRTFNGIVVIDEAYADFASEDCMDLALSQENVIVTRTLSKSFSLAGLRVGYAVGAEPLIGALLKVKDAYNVNALSQAAAEAALGDLEHMWANVERIRATRARLAGALLERGYRVFPSEANFLWVEPPGNAAAQFEALRAQKIFVRHFPGDITGAYLRISIGTDAEVDALLAAIERL